MAEAQALVIFGDGHQALYYDEQVPYTNRKGSRVQKILVSPTKELMLEYKLTEDDLEMEMEDGRTATWVEFPVRQILWLRRSKTGAVIMVFCAFNQGETQVMQYYDELLQFDENRDKTEARLRAEIADLQKELEDVTTNQIEKMRKFKDLRDAISDNDKDDEDDD